MKKTNEICQKLAQAEVNQSNIKIMSKREDNFPEKISQEFLQLQKQSILADLKKALEDKKKNQTNSSNPEESTLASQNQQERVPTSPLALQSDCQLATLQRQSNKEYMKR
jgi:hypothetical protein